MKRHRHDKAGPAAALALILLLSGLPQAQAGAEDTQAPEPLVAAQIHFLGGSTWGEIGAELDRLKADGFNAVFFRAFQNRGDRYHALAASAEEAEAVGLYFVSSLAPTVADMIPTLSQLCRERGMKLYAWMATRRMDWLEEETWRDIRYNLADGSLQTAAHYDLFNPDFAAYLLRLFEELAALPIDGIVLQDDFVIKTYEGFTPAGLGSFRLQNGGEASPRAMFAETFLGDDNRLHVRNHGKPYELWCLHKAERLRRLGEALAARCKRMKVNVEVVLNVYYDTVLAPVDSLCWLGQDLESIAASPFDRICLMAYHRQIAAEQAVSVSEAIVLTAELVSQLQQRLGDRLVVKLQSIDWESREEIDPAELALLLNAIGGGVGNWALAPVEPDGTVGGKIAPLLAERVGR
ncbi:MAG TPA: poly-beta-1,6-N-acetyl-D-glucosamine N-deacetylase PgaB [Acidobacteriota bacterium]|nr:poly-beta-1,6-N-acetyl-D-glucosamine N-deacetylase PgaB [Acidobacteriota bacterium]